MAETYYDNSDEGQRFQPGTTAEGEAVDEKFDQVASGLSAAEEDTRRALKFPFEPGMPSQEFDATALERRNKVMGFDADGNLVLTAGFSYRGDWATETEYFVNDVFRDPTSKNLYVVVSRHTSGVLADDIAAGSVELAIDVAEVEAAKAAAQQAQSLAEDARDASQTAKGLSEGARDASQSARDASQQAQADAETAETGAQAAYDDFRSKWQGLYATPPTLRHDGSALQEGDAYTDANTGAINLYLGGAWDPVTGHVRRTSTTGAAGIPYGTTAERPSSPVFGYTRGNTDTSSLEWWNGVSWQPAGGGATGAGGDRVFVENDQVVNNSYTIPAGKNASSVGPITVSDGVDVVVPDGSNWLVS